MRFILIYDSNNKKVSDRYQLIENYHQDVHQAIVKALEREGHHVLMFENTPQLKEQLKKEKPDFVFNCSIKSSNGVAGNTAPEILKRLKIPFTGSSNYACRNAYSKNRTKQILESAGINTPKAIQIRSVEDLSQLKIMKCPIFIKPARGGCSFGISQDSLVRQKENLSRKLKTIFQSVKQPLLLEEFLEGREFTIGLLGNEQLHVLPIMEFKYPENARLPFRSYTLKMIHYEDERVICPASLNQEERHEIEQLARKTFTALGCRDYARVDVRLDKQGKPYVLEVNVLPNLMPETSSFAVMAKEEGLSFTQLIHKITQTAARRYNLSIV